MPYRITERYPEEYVKKVCGDMAKQTERIIRSSIEQSKGKMFKLVAKELPDTNWMDVRN